MNAGLVTDRIVAALPAMEPAEHAAFMRSHRHGQRALTRLTEQLAGELYIQCLMDPDLGLDQDRLGFAIGDTPVRPISEAMWLTLCRDGAALARFRSAYARRYLTDVLERLSLHSSCREAA